REQIERGELLEHADRIGGAEDRDRARQADAARPRRGRGQNHGRSRIQVLRAMVLPDAEDIEAGLGGMLDLLDELAEAVGRRHRPARFGVCGGEAVNSYLHGWLLTDGGNYLDIKLYDVKIHPVKVQPWRLRQRREPGRDTSGRQARHPYVAGAHESPPHA